MSAKPTPPIKEDFKYFHPLRVRWSEVDPQGIVFNPNYLMYVDVGLFEWMKAIGYDYQHLADQRNIDMFMVNSTVNYFASATFDEDIEIGVGSTTLGRSSAVFGFGVFRDGQGLVGGSVTYVFASAGPDQTPVAIPDDIRALFD
jgi:acyl-CoA thioester hydrolase